MGERVDGWAGEKVDGWAGERMDGRAGWRAGEGMDGYHMACC